MRTWRTIAARILSLGLLAAVPVLATAEDGTVRISKIITNITGKTRRQALINELQIAEGREYRSLEFLTDVVELRVFQLNQRRLFKEFSVDINLDDPQNVVITIDLVDSFTIIPRPMIKYSSTQGLTLGAKVEYFNAFGTLSDHMIQGYWSPTEINFEYEASNITVGPVHLGGNFTQLTGLTRYGSQQGTIVAEYSTTSSTISASAVAPLGLTSPWKIEMEPIFSWIYDYQANFNSTPYPDNAVYKIGFTPGLDTTIKTDQTRWIGTYRTGFDFDFMNSNRWYVDTGAADIFLDMNLSGFVTVAPWFGLSGRIAGFYAFNGVRNDAGDRLRGVLDYNTFGQYGAYLNLQTEFKLFTTRRGISMHLKPFADIGYVYSRVWGNGPDAWEYTAGGTLMFFLGAMPSLNVVVEVGYDFKRGNLEVRFDTTQFF